MKIKRLPPKSKRILFVLAGLISLVLIFLVVFRLNLETKPTSIGVTFTTFRDTERNRRLKTAIWYPSAEGEGREWGGNNVFYGVHAAKNNSPQIDDKAPLYIFVHGTYGSWRNMTWLVEDLVEQGAIVAAANHPGSTWGKISPESVLHTWEQPEDVSFLIDSMLASEFGPQIDEENIVVVGFSLGGYTALSLSGAQLELNQLATYCASSNEEICDYLGDELKALDSVHFKKANQSYQDDRIRAAVALAPGFGALLEEESVQSLKNPVLIIGGQNDINVTPSKNLHPLIEHLPDHSRYHELLGATHFTFFRECKEGAMEILAKDGEEFVCFEEESSSRKEHHDTVKKLIFDFLSPEA